MLPVELGARQDRWLSRLDEGHRTTRIVRTPGPQDGGRGVTFINTDGMSFIGPGSEWFWTALSGIVLAVTFLAIFRQLQLQRSAAAVEQLNDIMREWSSERLARAKFTVLVALEAGTDPVDLPSRAVSTVGFFWQRVGFLVRGGNVDRQLVYANLGDQVQVWWGLIYPRAVAEAALNDPNVWHDFAWLAADAAAVDAKRGVNREVDPDSVRAAIPAMIAHFREAIELEEALRSVTVRLTPMPISVSSVRSGRAEADPSAT
jgi:hypothetical protein